MPQVHKEGKDTIIFASKEDHSTPSNVELPEPEPAPGLLLPNGEINWNCPCLGGMATGPCGLEFREAFNCFHLSNSDPKGAECTDLFRAMHVCITEYPALYGERHPLMDDYDEDDANEEHNKDTSTENRVPGTQTQLESKREDAPSMKQDLERTNVN